MFKKPVFWISFSLISVICTVFVFKFFPHAFPMLDLELTMDRESAIEKAAELNEKFDLSPEGYKDAAFFLSDGMTMIYVQLEGGGIDSCRKMMADTLFSLYFWRVRHFKENEIKEASYLFSPTGEVVGFYQKIPEDDPGAALSSDSALAIAERSCKDWNVDLTQWELVESSEEVRPSERVDHFFVYERPGIKVGEAPYRLDLTVRGDMLAEVDYSVKVPEAFKRRYQEMRSANELIANFASGTILILYILCGIGVGLFFIMRDRWLIWKRPLFWAVFVTSLSMLGQINYLPLSWNWYDTAVSASGFITEQIVQAILGSILMGVMLWLTFMAAESLSRRAFPNHPQLWRLWSKKNSASKEVLGLTAGGYGLIAVDIAFVLAFYFFTDKVLGWWSPVGSMVDPNILGTLYPWLSSVGMALQAGFWEECLFRAVPIAGAALIGQKYGKRNMFIILAVFIQALIFGAGHANYAQQPAYARVVELFLPSIFYAWVFIRFGLFPGIILHFAYDAVLMSLPLFIQSSDGIWFDRSMVIILTAVPILLILVRRVSVGKWTSIAAEHFNKAWIPALKKVKEAIVDEVQITANLSSKSRNLLLIGGILGVILYFGLHNWDNYATMLSMKKSEAIKIAEEELEEMGIVLGEDWKRLAITSHGDSFAKKFVWQTGEKDEFISLLKTKYLMSPSWRVRFARFDDSISVDERAEEYFVYVGQDENIVSYNHRLPEARPDSILTETEARIIAHGLLRDRFQRNPEEFQEVLAEETKKPERKDWRFEFSDTLKYSLEKGEARLNVVIRGNSVAHFSKGVKTSEEWNREQRDKRKVPGMISDVCGMIDSLFRITAVIIAVIVWSRRKFPVRIFILFLIILGSLKIITFFNNFPMKLAYFKTSEPFNTQLIQLFFPGMIMELIGAFGNALIAALAFKWIAGGKTENATQSEKRIIIIGFSVGAIWMGIQALITVFEPSISPIWITYGLYYSETVLPFLGSAYLFELDIKKIIITIFIFAALHNLTSGWQKRKLMIGSAFVLMFLCTNVSLSFISISYWLITGFCQGVVFLFIYFKLFKSNMAILPVFLSLGLLLGSITGIITYPHPVGIQISVISFVLILWFSIYWMKLLRRGTTQ
jgi:hypothetical protein